MGALGQFSGELTHKSHNLQGIIIRIDDFNLAGRRAATITSPSRGENKPNQENSTGGLMEILLTEFFPRGALDRTVQGMEFLAPRIGVKVDTVLHVLGIKQ